MSRVGRRRPRAGRRSPSRRLPLLLATVSLASLLLVLLASARAEDGNATLRGAAIDDVEPSDLLAAASGNGTNGTDDRGAAEIAVDDGGRPANGTDGVVGTTGGVNQTALNEILVKAAVAGVKKRGGIGEEGEGPSATDGGEDDLPQQAAPTAGCRWGDARCKAKHASQPPADDGGGGAGGVSLAGSATSRIKARLGSDAAPKARGDQPVPPAPPEGFRLAARVVTSPLDGLSYFLDADGGAGEGDGKGRPTTLAEHHASVIPYAYVECGSAIESTTEAFALTDVKVQHLPAGAGAGHFVNLSGGVTHTDGPPGEDDGETTSRRRSLGGWDGDGRPQLLVALTPIELTLSGNGEESRTFGRGDVVLLEDVAGMGHRMRSGEGGTDMMAMLVRLPHEVHLPVDLAADGDEETEAEDGLPGDFDPAWVLARGSARSALFGFGPGNPPRGRRRGKKEGDGLAADARRPCPLDYDSAHATLFEPDDVVTSRRRGGRRRNGATFPWTDADGGRDAFVEPYHPPPGHSTHGLSGYLPSVLPSILPSLRQIFLAGVGYTLSSCFVYILGRVWFGPPVLALLGGAFVVSGGIVAGVVAAKWGYREYLMDWEEEWMWRREVRRSRMRVTEEVGEEEEVDGVDASAKDSGMAPTAEAVEGESPDIIPMDNSAPEEEESEASTGVNT